MKIAIVGATGLVGSEMLKVLPEFLDCNDLKIIAAASSKSVGKIVDFSGCKIRVMPIEDAILQRPDIAIFSAGSEVSLQYAEKFAAIGTFVIDNSSAWRMRENIPLVVPEINAHILTPNDKIISNPNCSTIQMVLALAPLHKRFVIKRLVVATYQSVTGTGMKAVNQLMGERNEKVHEKVYPHQIDLNLLPHAGNFMENDYTDEEMKLVNETRKILNDQSIAVTATCVRTPVLGGHSEAVNIEFHNEFDIENIVDILKNTSGIVVADDPKKNIYPMPVAAQGKNDTFVGRIRRDESQPKSLNLWIVSDNLRKGAATNAVQIVKYLVENILEQVK
ncbi:MAG: aspartate-semialdehyde dehydrogenase [Bacteroidales bacterium]|jgi:aspartate-semialdehyde dehydrogenase|nr:aspartate-semialdehyde dehydrogenase [Bacteroidales bacterium]